LKTKCGASFDIQAKIYRNACLDGMKETGLDFPESCPYSMAEILQRELKQ